MTLRKWLRIISIALFILVVASFVFSRTLRTNAARRYLLSHLAASFGRPVEVSRFDFSLLDGPRIEAQRVTVAEDPRFGNEYFLRADALTAGLRWTALLAGRFEFGSVSLIRPSLNVVRDADGHWNIESWLPPAPAPDARAGFVGPVPPSRDARPTRLGRIDVSGGRINFKLQENKIPFALAGVSGRVEQDGAGRWQLDVEARPLRTGVTLQDIGTVRLRGRIAGTTARLQPADLNLTWRSASIADALRLARQNDYGLRGELSVDLDARIAPASANSMAHLDDSTGAQWSISGVARLTRIHGWRLPERNSDPATNLAAQVTWQLGAPRVEIQNLVLEMPGSRLQGAGGLEWSRGLRSKLQIKSSGVSVADLLSWYSAFLPGVADDLRADGTLGMDLTLGGWPIQLQQGAITSPGATLTSKSLPAPLQLAAMRASVSHGGLDLAPTEIFLVPAPSGGAEAVSATARPPQQSFTFRGQVMPEANGTFHWPPNWGATIEGKTSRIQDWLSLFAALGRQVNSGWTAEGGFAAKIRGARNTETAMSSWMGNVDLVGLSVSPAFVNQSIRLPLAHIEFAPQQRTVTLNSAGAFGANWRGTLSQKNSDSQWTFDLSADRLDVSELDRWLGPRARQGFLARFAGLQSSPPADPQPYTDVTQLAAAGRLRADRIEVSPIHFEKFEGQVEIAGRYVRIRSGQADFFGGKASGAFDARLQPDPSYEFKGQFEKVNLSQLGQIVMVLNDRMDGNVSASLDLSAHGIGRADLISSLEGSGTINGRSVELQGFDFGGMFPGDLQSSGPVSFSSVQGTFRIKSGGIDLANFLLDHSKEHLEAEGRIDFSHAMNVRIRPLVLQTAAATPAQPSIFFLGGSIEDPKLTLPSTPPSQTAKIGVGAR